MRPFAFLLCVLLIAISSTGCRRAPTLNNPPIAPIATNADDVDQDPRLSYRHGMDMKFGLTVLKDAAGKPFNKKLTYADPGKLADGMTNNTLVRIDKDDVYFGSAAGKWGDKQAAFGSGGSKTVWTAKYIQVTQLIEIVPSNQPVEVAPDVRKRLLDTCLVRYELENHDSRDHAVGLRILVDTLIGNNDGVPFAVPGLPGLINTSKDFTKPEDVPDFVQALEFPNLQNPGTVGLMTLKLGKFAGEVDAPSRVSLTGWPNLQNPPWEIQVRHMGIDSAVAIYWNADKTLKPGERRIVGFAYGLGQLAAGEGTGKLGLTVNGNFTPGGTFTVTTYVSKPAPNQTLSLDIPAGWQLVGGQATEKVPPPAAGAEGGDTSIVTWTVRAGAAGKHQVRVRSSTGVSQTQVVTIRAE